MPATYKGWTRIAPGSYRHTAPDGREARILKVPGQDGYGPAWMLTYYGEHYPDDAFDTLAAAVEAFGPLEVTR